LRGLVRLAASRPSGTAVTIDFEAAGDLGHELIVVRVPTPPSLGATDRRLAVLSARERQIAELIAQGLRNREIAARLSIARSTVKDHVHHILQKTRLRNRAAVAAATCAVRTVPRVAGKRNPPLDG
jgi:non-specific serine/threonine protein kinase